MPATSARVLAIVSDLAAGQWGLLTTAQAARAGVTRLQLARLADAAVLERVAQGIYATTAAPAEHREVRAAWLSLDPTSTAEERLADQVAAGVVSHTSAAALHRLGDLLDDEPELTLPHRKQSRRDVRLHRLDLTENDVTLVDGLPTTTVERTVADLLRDGHDPEHVAQIVGQGVRRGVIDMHGLARHLEPLSHRHGQPDGGTLVEHLLDLVGLSSAALARELAASPAGKELVAAGRYEGFLSALNAMSTITGLLPDLNFDLSRLPEPYARALEGVDAASAYPDRDVMASAFIPAIQVLTAALESVETSPTAAGGTARDRSEVDDDEHDR